jgi:hypothetical protein
VTLDLDNILLFAGMVVEAAIIALLIHRRVWRTLPLFCTYVVWGLCSDTFNYIIQRRTSGPASHGYLIAYLVTQVLDSALQISVLIELAWSTLRPLRPSLSKRALPLVVLLILAVCAAIWPFVGHPHLSELSVPWRNIVHLEQTDAILRILFFMVLAGCSQLLSIGWRDRELQVATGLGIYSFVSVSVDIWRQHSKLGHEYNVLNQIVVASYLVSLLYWGFSFAQREAARREFTPQMQSFLLAVAGTARTTRMNFPDADPDRRRDHDE